MVASYLIFLSRLTRDQKKLLLLIIALSLLTQVEYVYGFVSLDVTTVVDAVQATLHVVALCVSFFAISVAGWPRNEAFSYGHERAETLAAFANGCLVVLECAFGGLHALHDALVGSPARTKRPVAPQLVRIGTWRCLINIVGLMLFMREARAALRRGMRQRGITMPAHTENMSSVVMKLSASVASSFSLAAADAGTRLHWLFGGLELPLFIASGAFVVYLAVPLLASVVRVLLLAVPAEVQPMLDKCLREVSFTDGVLEVLQWSFWPLTSGQSLVGTVSVRIRAHADSDAIRKLVRQTCARFCTDLTVQVVRDQPLDMLLADRQKGIV